MAKKKQNMKTALLFMPDKFGVLSKKDLVNAFFAYYYEFVAKKKSDRQIQEMISFAEDNILNDEFANDILWKKLWFSYVAYCASTVQFHSLENMAIKEMAIIDELSDKEYAEFLMMADSAFRAYNAFDASIFSSFRLYLVSDKCLIEFASKKKLSKDDKKNITDQIGQYVKSLVIHNDFLKNNIFFEPMQVFFDWIEDGMYNELNGKLGLKFAIDGIFAQDEILIKCILESIEDFLYGGNIRYE